LLDKEPSGALCLLGRILKIVVQLGQWLPFYGG